MKRTEIITIIVIRYILKSVSDNPEKILLDWNINKANTPIDLKKRSFPYFIYSFPIIINNEEVATITLTSLDILI